MTTLLPIALLLLAQSAPEEHSCGALFERILAKGVAQAERIGELDSCLKPSESDSGLTEYRRLQVLSTLVKSGWQGFDQAAPGSQVDRLKRQGFLEPDPFGGGWCIPAARYWELYDRWHDQPWAEAVAWEAEQVKDPRDECMGDCAINLIVREQLQYWKRLPAGAHVQQALRDALKYARYASDDVCFNQPLGSRPANRAVIQSIRASLGRVRNFEEKRELLRYLALTERICGRPSK
jgi:hypothetical protein